MPANSRWDLIRRLRVKSECYSVETKSCRSPHVVMCGLLQWSVEMRLKCGVMRVLNTLQLYRLYVVYVYGFFSVDCFVWLDRSLQRSKNPLTASCCVGTNHRSKYLVDFAVPKDSVRTLVYTNPATTLDIRRENLIAAVRLMTVEWTGDWVQEIGQAIWI